MLRGSSRHRFWQRRSYARTGIFVGLLFLVGEERDSIGAKAANRQPIGSRFMINGEPTENKLALASKGALHVELVARGRMAHSAYPELGESAIDKLVEALHRLHAMKLPVEADAGACTKNVGLIQGGRAPNVISDFAKADLFYRLVGPADDLRREISAAVAGLTEVHFTRETPFLRLRTLDGLPTMVAAFTTDIPSLPNWGEPLLLGPDRFTWRTRKGSLWRRRNWRKRSIFTVRWQEAPGARMTKAVIRIDCKSGR